MSLQHDHILNPITALEFYQQPNGPLLLLAGEGSFLKIFDAANSRLLGHCEIFDGQTIHGIATIDGFQDEGIRVLIWGGSFLTLLNGKDFERLLVQRLPSITWATFEASDWILDATPSSYSPGDCFLITAHNTITRARLDNTSSHVTFKTIASPSRSILYSAHLVIEPFDVILVAAGTVFGEIIVWSCSTTGDAQVLFTFTGHEGSIFGVNFSLPLTLADKTRRRLLASCSDDRTIRVWDLSTVSATEMQQEKVALLRETGFGSNRDEQLQAEDRCIATVMAHASRIWRVKFLAGHEDQSHFSVSLLSFGEDSTTQQWNLDFDSFSTPKPASASTLRASRLSHMNTFAFHNGKHIWATAVHHANASPATLATGGADGKISLRSVEFSSEQPFSYSESRKEDKVQYDPSTTGAVGVQSRSLDLEDDILVHLPHLNSVDETMLEKINSDSTATVPPQVNGPSGDSLSGKEPKRKKSKKVMKDTFNKYGFVSEKRLLLTTTFGRILVANLDNGIQWEEVELPQSALLDLKSYSVMESIPELGLAYLAGANGKIYSYAGGSKVSEVGAVGGKVADMFTILNKKTGSFELLVTTLGTGVATLFDISPTGSMQSSVEYSLPPKFVVTSAGRPHDLIMLGSRSGSLAIFGRDDRIASYETKTSTASSEDAITTIMPLTSPTSETGNSSYILTTGRDGVYSVFTIASSSNSSTNDTHHAVRCVHVGSLPFGPMVEAAWFDGSDLLLYGFKSKNFIVWNETKQLEVMSVECGGAHRNYAYSPTRQSSGGHFVYTKASKLYIHSQESPSHTILKRGGHGREIKACAISPGGELIATGAEDTTIRIWSYQNGGNFLENQFRCHAIMQKHSAGIQQLHWHGSKYLFSSGGNEEFFIWAVERIPGFGIGVVCEASCPDQSEERDLRVMSLDVTDISEGVLLISLAYSDSTLRSYIYSKEDGYHLVAKGTYTSSCLTQIRHLQVSSKEAHILTAATDGNITFWKVDLTAIEDPESQLSFRGTQKVHQSTVKCSDFVKHNGSFLIVTGGDDNALGVSIYSLDQLNNNTAFTAPTSYILKSAHAAAITGLCIIPPVETNSTMDIIKIVSSSNDQRVKEWNVELSIDEEKNLSVVDIQNPSDEFTSIADVGDVAFLRGGNQGGNGSLEQKVVIVGNGMEVWKLGGSLN